jgi:hypothetical protein
MASSINAQVQNEEQRLLDIMREEGLVSSEDGEELKR